MTNATRTRWAGEVRRWRASGSTARAYAAQRGLNANTLRWWASALGRELPDRAAFVDLTALVATESTAKVSVIEVVVGPAVIRVPLDFDPAHLRAVVAALGTC